MSKPRSDSKLKTLPEDRQADIAAYCRDHSLTETVDWLKADGLKTSLGALSEFLSWYVLQQQLDRNESAVEALLERFKATNPDASPETVQAMGQEFFSALAMQQQDPKGWFLAQTLQLKKQSLAFDQEKFAESKKSDQEKALERCLEDSKQFPEVQELFKSAFAALKKARAKK